eukprot:4328003-Prymnesium_polylepis.2
MPCPTLLVAVTHPPVGFGIPLSTAAAMIQLQTHLSESSHPHCQNAAACSPATAEEVLVSPSAPYSTMRALVAMLIEAHAAGQSRQHSEGRR